MDSLKINRDMKRIAIDGGPDYIEFNPSDVSFAEKFYTVYREFEAKQKEYESRQSEIDAHRTALDGNGLPANIPDGLAFIREVCTFMRGRIDYLFGPGTSQKCFGDAMSLNMISSFFEGITPFIQVARSEKVAKYSNTASHQKRAMK